MADPQLPHGKLSLPSAASFHSAGSSGPGSGPSHSQRRSWQSHHIPSARSGKLPQHAQARRPSGSGSGSRSTEQEHEQARRPSTSASSARSAKWWRVRLFRGMVKDIKRRAPYYLSDWLDAWDYRIVPATIYMYFAKYACPSLSSSMHFFVWG